MLCRWAGLPGHPLQALPHPSRQSCARLAHTCSYRESKSTFPEAAQVSTRLRSASLNSSLGREGAFVLQSERKRLHKRGRLFQGRVDRNTGKNSWRPPFWFQAELKHSGSLSHRGLVQTVSGDSITLNRVRLESEYLVSQCGTLPRNCSISGGKQI